MRVTGVVRTWQAEEGWGVIDSPSTPGGCWTHFSSVLMPGYRELTPGQEVELSVEAAAQDGYRFRAVEVWPKGQDPDPGIVDAPPAITALESTLTVTYDEPDAPDQP